MGLINIGTTLVFDRSATANRGPSHYDGALNKGCTTLRAMAKTYRPYVPEQDLLLPPRLREWLPEDHLAFFVSDLIDHSDLSAITTVYEDEERGSGISGAKDRRPALDQLLAAQLADARRRRFDVLICWRIDPLGRNLRHLITLLDELQALGVAFVSLAEGIDATTPAGMLQMHILGAIAEFERGRIVERVKARLVRARAQGRKLGRPERKIPEDVLDQARGLSVREAAAKLGVARQGPSLAVSENTAEITHLDPREPQQTGALMTRAPRFIKHLFCHLPRDRSRSDRGVCHALCHANALPRGLPRGN
jgi:DNA invertase Pin-like site-specific DNA recombinase